MSTEIRAMDSDEEMNLIEQEYSVMVPVPFDDAPSDASTPLVETERPSHDEPSLEQRVKELELEIKETRNTLNEDVNCESKNTSDEEEFEDVENYDTFSEQDSTVKDQSLLETSSNEEQKYKLIEVENSELRELLGYLLPPEDAANTLTKLKRVAKAYRKVKSELLNENKTLDTLIAETESSCQDLLTAPNIHKQYQDKQQVVETKLAEAHEELTQKSETIAELTKDLETLRGRHEQEVSEAGMKLQDTTSERDQLKQLLSERNSEISLVREECSSKEDVIRQLIATASRAQSFSSNGTSSKKRPFPKLRKASGNKDAETHQSRNELSAALLVLQNQVTAQETRFQEHLEEVRMNLRKEEATRKRLEGLLVEGSRLMNNVAFSCTCRLRDIQRSISTSKLTSIESFKQWIGGELKNSIGDLEKLRLMDLAKRETEFKIVDPPLDPKERKCAPFDAV